MTLASGSRRRTGDGEPAEVVRVVGCAVLEPHVRRGVEENVDRGALRRRQKHGRYECLALVASAITADELHACATHCEVEESRVGGIDEVEPHDPRGAVPENSVSPLMSSTLPNRPIATNVAPDLR